MKKLIIVAFLGFAVASCGQKEETSTSNDSKSESSQTGEKRIERVDEVTFLSFIQETKDVQIVNVRTQGKYEVG